MLRFLAPVLLCLVGTLTTSAQPSAPDPRQILRSAAEASRALGSARTGVVFAMQYMSNPGTDTTIGRASIVRDTNEFGSRYRFESTEGMLVVFRGDALEGKYPADDTLRIYDSTMHPAELAGNGAIGELSRMLFDASRRIDRALNRGTEIRYLGLDTVGGVVCHAIDAAIADTDDISGVRVRFSVGVDDHYLRRCDDELVWNGMTQRRWITLTDFEANPTIAPSTFTIARTPGMITHVVRPSDYTRPALIAVGATAPAWRLADSLGTVTSLEQYAGRVVVLDFWGSWCGPCVMSLPELQKLSEEYAPKGVVVVGLSCNEPPGARPTWLMRSRGCTYPLVVDADSVAKSYSVSSYPTTVIIGADGTVIHTSEGFDTDAPYAAERAALDAYLKQRGM